MSVNTSGLSLQNNCLEKLMNGHNVDEARELIRRAKREHKFCQCDRWVVKGQIEALKNGRVADIEMLVREGISFDKLVNDKGELPSFEGKHLITYLFELGDIKEKAKKIQFFVRERFKVSNSEGLSESLKSAIEKRDSVKARKLLAFGASAKELVQLPDTGRDCCRSSLLVEAAVQEGGEEMVDLLIEHGAKLAYGFDTALHVYKQRENVAKRTEPHRNRVTDTPEKIYGQRVNATRILLDRAVGMNLHSRDLEFLENLDVSGMNFIGVSCDGSPLTREILRKSNLNIQGVDSAIFTMNDLRSIEDEERRELIRNSVDRLLQERGCTLEDKEAGFEYSVLNLVDYLGAIVAGNEEAAWDRRSKMKEDEVMKLQGKDLLEALKNGHFEIARRLREEGVNLPDEQDAALFCLEKRQRRELVEQFWSEKSATASLRGGSNALHLLFSSYFSPLICSLHETETCSDEDKLSMLRFFVDQGVDVNAVDNYGATPLHILCREMREEPTGIEFKAIEFLLISGAIPEIRDGEGKTALDILGKDHFDRFASLSPLLTVEGGVKPLLDKEGVVSRFHEVERDEFYEYFDNLIEEHHAAGNVEEVKWLYEKSFYDFGDVYLCRKLRELGGNPPAPVLISLLKTITDPEGYVRADVNIRDDDQNSPLLIAAENLQPRIISFLCRAGADVSSLDRKGFSVYQRIGEKRELWEKDSKKESLAIIKYLHDADRNKKRARKHR